MLTLVEYHTTLPDLFYGRLFDINSYGIPVLNRLRENTKVGRDFREKSMIQKDKTI